MTDPLDALWGKKPSARTSGESPIRQLPRPPRQEVIPPAPPPSMPAEELARIRATLAPGVFFDGTCYYRVEATPALGTYSIAIGVSAYPNGPFERVPTPGRGTFFYKHLADLLSYVVVAGGLIPCAGLSRANRKKPWAPPRPGQASGR